MDYTREMLAVLGVLVAVGLTIDMWRRGRRSGGAK